jgi:hypothetical protein
MVANEINTIRKPLGIEPDETKVSDLFLIRHIYT